MRLGGSLVKRCLWSGVSDRMDSSWREATVWLCVTYHEMTGVGC